MTLIMDCSNVVIIQTKKLNINFYSPKKKKMLVLHMLDKKL
jgi:hypothetical protein